MARDHFVPQVYLKCFGDPNFGGRLHCYRKKDLKYFSPRPKDILRAPDGNTLKFSADPQELENLAAWLEPSLDRIRGEVHRKIVTDETRVKLSFLMAYLTIASPTFRRCGAMLLERALNQRALDLDAAGHLPPFPEVDKPNYSRKSVANLISSKLLTFNVESDVVRTFAMQNVGEIARKFCNGSWTFLEAPLGTRFITSDFPVAFVDPPLVPVRRRFFPLDSRVAIEVLPQAWNEERGGSILGTYAYCSEWEVERLNKLMIAGAEEIVICSQKSARTASELEKLRNSKTEMVAF